MSFTNNLRIAAKPIAALLSACVISTFFIGPPAILIWITVGLAIIVALRRG